MKDFPAIAAALKSGMDKLGEGAPGTMGTFGGLMAETAGKDGTALDVKTKELIALAIAVSLRCDGCIAHHAHAVLEQKASREELLDTLGVAIMMGGGPSVVYGIEALEAYDQFVEAAG